MFYDSCDEEPYGYSGRNDDSSNDSDHDYEYSSQDDDGYYRYHVKVHRRDILAMLNNQRKTRQYTDVVVEVAGTEFPCHSAVLACSPFFNTMLSSEFAESSSKVIQLREVDTVIFSKILDFVYTGMIYIGEDDVQDILQAAHMLQIDKIVRHCLKFIQKNLSASNCVNIMRLADTYNFSDLKKEGRDVAVEQFLEVGQNAELLTLTTDELVDLLADKDLQITNEDDVVNCVIRWLDHDAQGREASMPTIIQQIHLSCVKVSALEKLESHPVVRESRECLAKITAAKEEHLSGTRSEDVGADADVDGNEHGKRNGISDKLAIIVGGWKVTKQSFHVDTSEPADPEPPEPIPLQSMICLDPDCQQFYHVTDLPTSISGSMSVTSAGRQLYITGGRAHLLFGQQGPDSAPSRQAFRYDFLTDTWTQLPDMPRGRAEHQSIVADGKLFLIGGDVDQGEGKFLLDVDCFDVEQGVWMNLPKTASLDNSCNLTIVPNSFKEPPEYFESAPQNFTVTALQGKVVVVEIVTGTVGFASFQTPRVYTFDTKTLCWTSVTSGIQVPDGLVYADKKMDILSKVVDDRLYFHTGESYYNDFYAYDVKENVLVNDTENKEVFKGSFFITACTTRHGYDDEGKCIIDTMICSYDYHDNERNSVLTTLPFLLFEYSFIGTKKTSVGWYCRDLTKVEDEDETDDNTITGCLHSTPWGDDC